jgi:hypothetical protein
MLRTMSYAQWTLPMLYGRRHPLHLLCLAIGLTSEQPETFCNFQ